MPAEAADGKAILYSRNGKGIVRRELASGQETILVPVTAKDTTVDEFVMDRTGTKVAYLVTHLRDAKAPSEICITSLPSGPTRVLYTGAPFDLANPEAVRLTPGAWTNDGKAVLAAGKTSAAEKSWGLWRLELAGGAPQPTGLSADRLWQVSLHPDGTQVSYMAGEMVREVWVIEHLPK